MLLRGVAMVTMAMDFKGYEKSVAIVTIATPLSNIK